MFFLLYVLNLIFSRAYYYCYCKKINKKCSFCKINTVFVDFEELINKNRHDGLFLTKLHEKLLPFFATNFR